MKLLKYLVVFLALSGPVHAYEAMDEIKVVFLCRNEAAAMKIALADIEGSRQATMLARQYTMMGVCGSMPNMLDAFVN